VRHFSPLRSGPTIAIAAPSQAAFFHHIPPVTPILDTQLAMRENV
jgi:hypothetical protein